MRKLRVRQGFTLSELLITVVLVGLITLAVAGGVGMVSRSYTKVVDRADAETLLATTLNKMQDELCFARVDLETPTGTDNWSFISGVSGLRIRFNKGAEPKGAYMEFLVSNAGSSTNNKTYYFTEQNNNRMYVTYESCVPAADANGKVFGFTITNLRVVSTKTGQILAQMPEDANATRRYYVAAINYRA